MSDDITENAQHPPSEKDKPSKQASYSDLFLRLLDSIFLLDKESYSLLEANDASERFLEMRTEEMVGKSFQDFILEEDQEDLGKRFRIAKRKYYPIEFEARAKTSSGKIIYLRLSACSLKLATETEVLQVIAKDITKEKEADQKIENYMKELQMLNAKLEQLSITDELTKLWNVRHFRTKLAEEFERASRYKSSFSVILFDVDNFKHYNDSNGHPAGDQLLRVLGKILLDVRRKSDLPARYGGEEFVILCPETDWKGALLVAERYRKMIESHPFDFADKQPLGKVSVSIGVASFPEVSISAEEIVLSADKGLYYSKRTGRNRSTAFENIKHLPNSEIMEITENKKTA